MSIKQLVFMIWRAVFCVRKKLKLYMQLENFQALCIYRVSEIPKFRQVSW
jgi:hypothetical protein